jgi:hypothetical protein
MNSLKIHWNHLAQTIKKNDDHPLKDLAKSGYTLDVEYNSLTNLLYSWLHIEKKKKI